MEEVREKKRPLRVLCLHGYRQNGQIFREKTGALRKALKGRVEFEFISATLRPNLAPSTENGGAVEKEEEAPTNNDGGQREDEEGDGPRAWWFSSQQGTFSSKEATEIADGFEQSAALVANVLSERGPFDGLLGFSQGASFIHLLLASRHDGLLPLHQIRFVLLFSAFKSLSSVHRPLMDSAKLPSPALPSVHVYGLADEIVLGERSEELAGLFENAIRISHPGKHCIPPARHIRHQLTAFLDQF